MEDKQSKFMNKTLEPLQTVKLHQLHNNSRFKYGSSILFIIILKSNIICINNPNPIN